MPLVSERNKGIAIRFDEASDSLSLTARHPDLGEATDSVVINGRGPSFEKSYNAHYLLEALAAFESASVSWLHNQGGPAVFQANPETDHFNLVMPMRK
jgi:DNA polymerase III sliding clamp (beta) subunit (PCNA family)